MHRFPLLLTLGLVFVLFATAAAIAAPPTDDWCGPNGTKPDHPSCSDTPEPDPDTLEACPTGQFPIAITKPGFYGIECLWTPEDPGTTPVSGTVMIAPPAGITSLDGVSSLLVLVRDDSPGDICLLVQEGENQTEPDGSFVGSFDLTYGTYADIVEGVGWDPLDYPEEERPPSFDPYVNESYWTFRGEHWCYPQDQVPGMREDLNSEPLHLLLRFRAKKNAPSEVLVTLTPAQKAGP